MSYFAPILPEVILVIGATVLMMVAAFARAGASGMVSWIAVAVLAAATAALFQGAAVHAGPAFGGLIAADGFGAFAKAIIYPAAAVAILMGHGWFEKGTEHGNE